MLFMRRGAHANESPKAVINHSVWRFISMLKNSIDSVGIVGPKALENAVVVIQCLLLCKNVLDAFTGCVAYERKRQFLLKSLDLVSYVRDAERIADIANCRIIVE